MAAETIAQLQERVSRLASVLDGALNAISNLQGHVSASMDREARRNELLLEGSGGRTGGVASKPKSSRLTRCHHGFYFEGDERGKVIGERCGAYALEYSLYCEEHQRCQ